MIYRIFRVRVHPNLKDEFEEKFRSVSVAAVDGTAGCLSVTIASPTVHAPDEYVMITQWRDVEALRAFAGDNWDAPHIPDGMQQYAAECWVHHYEAM